MPTFVLFNIYLFYGLVFFAIGCVIVFRNFKYSQLEVASTLWALAIFGFFHAFHEWSELYVILFDDNLDGQFKDSIAWIRLWKLFLSYIALMLFAWLILSITNKVVARVGHILIIAILLYCLVSIYLNWRDDTNDQDFFLWASSLIRSLIGFGSALLAGIGLIIYGHMLKRDAKPYGQYFIGSGVGLVIYGILSGLVPTEIHHSVPVMRTIAATVILVCLYQALRIFDIEREQVTEAKLKRAIEADKYNAIGQLAMGVAHEVNNPLASATLALDLLERQQVEYTPAQVDYIQRVRLGIHGAATISKELLNYARPVSEDLVSLNLKEVLDSAIALLAHKSKAYKISISCERDIRLVGQKIKLEELFINLICNAIDASKPNQEIGIILLQNEKQIEIKVMDRGAGMDKESLARAFEPFYSTKAVRDGTGLGLAICEKIVTSHGGRIMINSELNFGTQILIIFPRESRS